MGVYTAVPAVYKREAEGAKSTHQKYHIFNYTPVCSNSGGAARDVKDIMRSTRCRGKLRVFNQTILWLRAEIWSQPPDQLSLNKFTHSFNILLVTQTGPVKSPEGPHPTWGGEKKVSYSLHRTHDWFVFTVKLLGTFSDCLQHHKAGETKKNYQTDRQTEICKINRKLIFKCFCSRKSRLYVKF